MTTMRLTGRGTTRPSRLTASWHQAMRCAFLLLQRGALVVALAFLTRTAGAQYPRLISPPPCPADAPAVRALTANWGSAPTRGRGSRVAVFPLATDVDDPTHVHVGASLQQMIAEQLGTAGQIRVATEGSVARAMNLALGRPDSAAVLLGAEYQVRGQVTIRGGVHEVSLSLLRSGRSDTVWRASFRETASLQDIERAAVSGVWRALSLTGSPPPRSSWPANATAFELLAAGDRMVRFGTVAALDSAAAMYARALELEPRSAILFSRLARARVEAVDLNGGRRDGAVGDTTTISSLIRRALALDSTRADAWTARAILSRVEDPVRFAGAVDAHRRALALAPRDADAEEQYAETLLRLGNTPEAERHLRRALALEPNRARSLGLLGEMRRRTGSWAESCSLVNASVAAWPYDPRVYATRALTRLHLADARDAYSDAELVRRLTSGAWTDALRVLVADGAGETSMARQRVQGLTATWLATERPLSVRDAEYIALAYLTVGDQRRAVESLRRARPVGADLGQALRGAGLEAIRADTTIRRLLRETGGR